MEINSPSVFALYQNYPNPFNPETVIKFSLPSQGLTTVRIYNQLGEEIKTLFNGSLEKGNHEITFNASGLSTGVYFYKIVQGSSTSVKKMMYLK